MYHSLSHISSAVSYRTIIGLGIIGACLLFASSTFAAGATLWLDPANKVITQGDRVQVNIILDTGGSATDGIDIHFLKYNPQYLRIEDSDSLTSGVQIHPGTLYPTTKTNIVDPIKGTIDFSQITTGGTTYMGRGILATITFTVVGANSSDMMFDFKSGVTTDTNVASKGKDILTMASGSRFVFAYTKPITPPTEPPVSPGIPGRGPIQSGQALIRNLWRSLRHAEVKILQDFLIARGYLSSDSNTGFYGVLTETAVKRFQCDQNIVCSGDALTTGYGAVGPKTKGVINQLMSGQAPLDARQQLINQLLQQIEELKRKIEELLAKRK